MGALMCVALANPSYDTIVNALEECAAEYTWCWRYAVRLAERVLARTGARASLSDAKDARELVEAVARALEREIRRQRPDAPESTVAEAVRREVLRVFLVVLSVLSDKSGARCRT